MKKIRAFICFLGCFFKNAGQKNCTKIFQPFSNISLFKQIKNWGGRFFEKPSTPIFFICLNFIGVAGDENLKKYLARPYDAWTVHISLKGIKLTL